MGFVVSSGTETLEEREIRGHWQKVAVDCWFTSTGRAMPRMVKYEDQDGCLQVLRDIRVVKQEQKHYAGVCCQRFDCRTVIDHREYEFILLFHFREHTWDMILRQEISGPGQ